MAAELTIITLKAKPGSLAQFADVYRRNPMRFITEDAKTSPLYILSLDEAASIQTTVVFWDAGKRVETQESAGLKESVVAVKNSGLLGGPPSAVDFTVVSDEGEKDASKLRALAKSVHVVGPAGEAPRDVLRTVVAKNGADTVTLYFSAAPGPSVPTTWFVR